MACTRKVTPFRIIGRGSFEEGRVSVADPHGKKSIFDDWYCEIFPYVFTFVCCLLLKIYLKFLCFE